MAVPIAQAQGKMILKKIGKDTVNLSIRWETVLQRCQRTPGSARPLVLGRKRTPDACALLLISSTLVFVQLSEWWLKTAYLQFRQPVVIYSSPGVMLPKQDFMDLQGQLR